MAYQEMGGIGFLHPTRWSDKDREKGKSMIGIFLKERELSELSSLPEFN